MKVFFHLPYKTAPDESLCAVVFIRAGKETQRQQIILESPDREHWTGQLELSTKEYTLTYSYYTLTDGQIARQEWNILPRVVFLQADKETYHFYDFWADLPAKSWLYSAALAPQMGPQPLTESPSCIVLRAHIPGLQEGQKPYLCGEHPALGAWNAQQALPLVPANINEWKVALDASLLSFPTVYKFVIKNADGSFLWELDGNRVLNGPQPGPAETWVYSGLYPRFDIKPVRAAGTVIPVFSIRTETDWGAGDFGSLKTFVDWAA